MNMAEKTVRIIDNGGIPFIVRLSSLDGEGRARIFARSGKAYARWQTIRYRRALVGRDPDESGARQWWHGGSSVLLCHVGGYVTLIGVEITRYWLPERVRSFVSLMGNSDVVWPFAVGRSFTYLFYFANVRVRTSDLARLADGERDPRIQPRDPYAVFYRNMETIKSKPIEGRVLHPRVEYWG
jgi:hypothetical protein